MITKDVHIVYENFTPISGDDYQKWNAEILGWFRLRPLRNGKSYHLPKTIPYLLLIVGNTFVITFEKTNDDGTQVVDRLAVNITIDSINIPVVVAGLFQPNTVINVLQFSPSPEVFVLVRDLFKWCFGYS